jgi:nitrate reductase gamma subunit
MEPGQVPTREILWNVEGGWLVYPLMIVVAAAIGVGLWQQVRLWRRGRHEMPTVPLAARLRSLLLYALGQARVIRDPLGGTLHVMLYSGFLVLFLGTLMIAVQEDLRVHFLEGSFYLFYSLFLDLFGVVALVGLLGLAYRRYVLRPRHLDSGWDDALSLALLAAILVGGYVLEALRLAATEIVQHPDWAAWSPVGAVLARGLLAAGVRRAVVSLWPVDDSAACVSMVAFHERLVRGEPPAAALAAVQRNIRAMTQADLMAGYEALGGEPADASRARRRGAGAPMAAARPASRDELPAEFVDTDEPATEGLDTLDGSMERVWAPFILVGA